MKHLIFFLISVEGLAEGISDLCLKKLGIESLTIRVEKPRALLLASSAGVQIKRSISTENVYLLPFFFSFFFQKNLIELIKLIKAEKEKE